MLKLPRELIDETIVELQSLLSKGTIGGDFYEPVLNKLLLCRQANYSVPLDQEKFYIFLERNAIRSLDSFDNIPDAKNFLNLTSKISCSALDEVNKT